MRRQKKKCFNASLYALINTAPMNYKHTIFFSGCSLLWFVIVVVLCHFPFLSVMANISVACAAMEIVRWQKYSVRRIKSLNNFFWCAVHLILFSIESRKVAMDRVYWIPLNIDQIVMQFQCMYIVHRMSYWNLACQFVDVIGVRDQNR